VAPPFVPPLPALPPLLPQEAAERVSADSKERAKLGLISE
jgi:hypothetical protein